MSSAGHPCRNRATGAPEPCLTHIFSRLVFLSLLFSFSSQGGRLPRGLGRCGPQCEGEGAKGGWMVRDSPKSSSTCPLPPIPPPHPPGSGLPGRLSRVTPSSHSLSRTLCDRYTSRDLRCPPCEPSTPPSTLPGTAGMHRLYCSHFKRWSSAVSWFPWEE